MHNSIIYQDILEEGMALGLAKGLIDGQKKTLLLWGKSALGPPTPRQEMILKAITDGDRLNRMAESVSKIKTWSKLLAIK